MKKRIIVFGAGNGGLRVSYLLDEQYEIIAYSDNNPEKQGNQFLNKPVIPPVNINDYDFDLIIIATLNAREIYMQLTDELKVDEHKIIDYFQDQMLDVRLSSLRLVADEVYENKIEGSVAELGVYQGEFAKYINYLFRDRKFYLFDTFSGFAEKDVKKEMKENLSNAVVGEFKNEDVQLVLDKMNFKDNCIVRKGYFPETSIGIEDSFAFVSLDVDLYGPILEGLKFFYPRLSKGGYIFVHDYNSTRFHGVKKAVREYCNEQGIRYVPLSDICGSVAIVK